MESTKFTSQLKAITMLLCMVLISMTGFSQDPGGSPDGPPPAVPFDDYAHILLILVGIALAGVIFYRRRNISLS